MFRLQGFGDGGGEEEEGGVGGVTFMCETCSHKGHSPLLCYARRLN